MGAARGKKGRGKGCTLGVERRFATGENPFMKSAYELAMERLEQSAPTRQLSAEQKSAIAEIDSTHRAKIAERELFLKGEIVKEMANGRLSEAESLQKQLAMDMRRLNEEWETKKAKVRDSKPA
jgi:hypothetical protein